MPNPPLGVGPDKRAVQFDGEAKFVPICQAVAISTRGH